MNAFGPGADTSLGGGRRDFPSTCWSRFLGGADRAAAETLARSYWKPVYAYIRVKWSKSNEDAKDLAQDFFVWMIEGDFLGRADPNRGRFRAFLKTALQHYLSNETRDQQTLKRGGGRKILALDHPSAAELPVIEGASADDAMDETWRRELFARAMERLETFLRGEGKEAYFAVFRDLYLQDSGGLSYRQVGERHGVTEKDVENHLAYAKRKCREILTELVAETVGSDADLREELALLFGPESP